MSVLLVWSRISNWKPPNVDRPWIGGGGNATTMAPGIMNSGPLTRFSTDRSECSAPSRSAYSLRRAKIRPLFGAAPEKLKPITENAAAMSGSP